MSGNFIESRIEDAAVNETLLPMLISGELRAKTAGRIVENVV